MIFKGTLDKVFERSVNTRRGPATFYSLKLDEYKQWFSAGSSRPAAREGDLVEVEAEQTDRGFWNATHVKAIPAVATSAPEAMPAKVSGKPGVTVPAQGVTVDRQFAITLQHSQEMAIRAVALLLAHDALPLSVAKTKAGEAKRFEEVVAAIDKFTVKFHRDIETGRLFGTVADMGVVDTSADGPIPDDGRRAADTSGDDI